MIKVSIICILAFSLIHTTLTEKCRHPKGADGFKRDNYKGTWYEIAKFQTAGGAYWEKDCVCTSLNVVEVNSKLNVHNICRNKTPSGKTTDAVGTLTDDLENLGHFKQKFFWFTPSVDYTIIFQGELNGEEYSVEYDCNESFIFGTNYCVHFLSRKPSMSEELLNLLIEKVNQLDLNSQKLDLERTKHEGCWK